MDRRYDLTITLAFIALGIFIILVARTIPLGVTKDVVGTRSFFYGVGILFIVGGCLLSVQRLRNWKAQKDHIVPSEGTEDEKAYPASAKRAASYIGIAIGYAILLKPLGYLLTTPLFIAGAMLVLKQRNKKMISLLAVGFTLVFYIVFAQLLGLRIPVGPFTNLFRDLGWIIL